MENTSTNIIDIIKKISDLKFQKDVWLEGKYWDRVSSFDEAVNTLEDYNFISDINENRIGLTESEKNKIESFTIKLMGYEDKNPQLMLDDSTWQNIAKEACEIVPVLKKYIW